MEAASFAARVWQQRYSEQQDKASGYLFLRKTVYNKIYL
jgi:hypothetical protein